MNTSSSPSGSSLRAFEKFVQKYLNRKPDVAVLAHSPRSSTLELQTFPGSFVSSASVPNDKDTIDNSILPQSAENTDQVIDGEENAPPPTAVRALEQWNKPASNVWRVIATFLNFFMMGMNDAALGALLPYLENYYKLSYTVISLIFLSPFAGTTLASMLNSRLHTLYGRRAIAFIGPGCHLVSFSILAFHPPYPVLIILFALLGFGNGLIDAAWCAWIGGMANANRISGVLQSFYSAGATVSPIIATTMIVKGNLPWYKFYYLMASAAAIELIASVCAFWHSTGAEFRLENPNETNKKHGHTRDALKNKTTWLLAIFLLCYTGSEIALAGWIVTFMIKVRHASNYSSGITATGFWGGMTAGRALLGFVTERFGERLSVILYLFASVALELCFWLIPRFIGSAIAVAFLGFFMGPLVPSVIVLCTKLLPKSVHVGAIGFATAFGAGGGAVLPFAVGAIAQARGVGVLQPIILAVLVVLLGIWLGLTQIPKRAEVMV